MGTDDRPKVAIAVVVVGAAEIEAEAVIAEAVVEIAAEVETVEGFVVEVVVVSLEQCILTPLIS